MSASPNQPRNVFTDDAKGLQAFLKTDRTFAKYNKVNPYFGKKRILEARIDKPDGPNKSSWVIPKSKEPGPGSYEVEKAIIKCVQPNIKGPIKATDPKVCFVDTYKKRYKSVPGAGAYEEDKFYKKVYKDPAFKSLRH